MSTLSTPAKTLVIVRLMVGVGALFAPRLAAKLFAIDPEKNPQSPYLGRLFGVRDIALAAGVLLSQGEARRTWLKIGVGVDATDVVSAGLGARDGSLGPMTWAGGGAVAAMATALGAAAVAD